MMDGIHARVDAQVEEAVRFAEDSPEPDVGVLMQHVFSEVQNG